MRFGAARLATEKADFRPALLLSTLPGITEMQMDFKHKAIETEYAGYRFRSRLEARWAVFFDAIGIKWKYELQGYESEDGARYLPDFYLPDDRIWVEVKGDPDGFRKDAQRMTSVLGANSPLPGFHDEKNILGDAALLVLSDIPSHDSGIVIHPLITQRDGRLQRMWAFFAAFGSPTVVLSVMEHHAVITMFGIRGSGQMENNADSPGWDIAAHHLPVLAHCPKAREAYRKAKQSRFEHGQSGAI